MYKIIFILFFLVSSLFSKTIITVTHPVQEYFIKKIAGKNVFVRTVFSKKKPYDPTNRKIVNKLSSARAYFTLGLEEENDVIKLLKAKNEELVIINTTKGIGTLKLKNGKENPYVWLDPLLAREFAMKIYGELVKLRYYDRVKFKENLDLFLNELDKIYLDLKRKVDDSHLYGFFVFNNQLDYFAKRFRVDIYHKEYKLLHISEVTNMIRFVRQEHIKHIVIPKNSDYRIAQSFSGHIDGKIVEYDIYDLNWKVNMFSLIRGITNFRIKQ